MFFKRPKLDPIEEECIELAKNSSAQLKKSCHMIFELIIAFKKISRPRYFDRARWIVVNNRAQAVLSCMTICDRAAEAYENYSLFCMEEDIGPDKCIIDFLIPELEKLNEQYKEQRKKGDNVLSMVKE